MAAGIMYAYEDYYCVDECEHTDCASALQWRQIPCKYCNKPVKTGEEYYTEGGNNNPYHAYPNDCEGLKWSDDGMRVLPVKELKN